MSAMRREALVSRTLSDMGMSGWQLMEATGNAPKYNGLRSLWLLSR